MKRVTYCANDSSSFWLILRRDAAVGLSHALTRKFSTNSLASWSKEKIEAGFNIRVGPCRVVRKARHIRASNIPYSASVAMNVVTCFIRSELPSYISSIRSQKCYRISVSRTSVGMRRPVASPASVGLCSGGGRGGSSLSCYIARGCPSEGNNALGGAAGAV
ncbi:hypothetical protein GW17_00059424 [Ensete ventricosum]|nr:hypothetical protein GW17_00059424 [Ensete ventricosum]